MSSGEAARVKGNQLFTRVPGNAGNGVTNNSKESDFNEAMIAYNEAISKDPTNAIHLRNRALCRHKLSLYKEAEDDVIQSLKLEPKSVKGNYLMGIVLTRLNQGQKAVEFLQEALRLSFEQGVDFSNEIGQALFQAKKARWEERMMKLEGSDLEFYNYLKGLVEKEKQSALQETPEDQREKVNEAYDAKFKDLHSFVLKGKKTPKDIPQHFFDSISFELMRDPVITPSGVTYDRATILDHLRKVGHFDPVTRQELTENQLVANLALKEVLDEFLEENGWAEDF